MLSRDRLIGAALLGGHLLRHALRPRRTVSLEQRLAMIPARQAPVTRRVVIHWNAHQVPFIEAENDHDLAVALGMVHAHLRLGQIELMRRLAQGRVAEMIGPIGVALDRLLRTLDVGRAVPALLAAMPDDTRAWIDAFVQGLNHYLMHATALPMEFALFGLPRTPWSSVDVLTLGRLASADVNWIVWSRLLRFRNDPDWPLLWQRLMASDVASPSMDLAPRSGSNAFVIAPQRSVRDAPLMASDPHLSLTLPSPWLVAAFRSPSCHAAGLMIPGLPFVAIGRNASIAWGGTSLHAASSDLVAVPPEAFAAIGTRKEAINVRWGRRRTIRVRDSAWGPIVSDIPFLAAGDATIALRWMGHAPSDELTAMLAVNRAGTWDAFQTALGGFAVPGQTMLYADTGGHIGRLMAVHLPRRRDGTPADILTPPTGSDWKTHLTSRDLPVQVNPPQGFLASANERPDAATEIGYHFSPRDRRLRLDRLLGGAEPLSVTDVKRIQQDVHAATALAQCRQLLRWIGPRAPAAPRAQRFLATLAAWEGGYDIHSRGALAFELVYHHLARRLVRPRWRALYDAGWGARSLIWNDILAAAPARRGDALRRAVRDAARALGADDDWGRRHRLRLGHLLALAPVLGRHWRCTDLPAAGSSETLLKTAHPLTQRRHAVRYGSGARCIVDLSDLDRNEMVLLGGQDGWLGSTTFLDQLTLWQRGEYMTIPLRPATAHVMFPYRTDLDP